MHGNRKVGRLISILFLAAGFAFFGLLIHTLDAGAIARELGRTGIYFPIIIIPYLLAYSSDTVGWRYSFAEKPAISLFRLYWVRLIGESMNTITPAAYLGGEPVKVLLMERHGVKMVEGASSVVVAKTVMTIAEAIFIMIGIGIAIHQIGMGSPLVQGVMWAMAAFIPICVMLLVLQRMGMFGALVRIMRYLGVRRDLLAKFETRLLRIDESLSRYYREEPRGLALGILFHLIGWTIGVGEAYLLLWLLGVPVNWGMAFVVESLGAMIRGAIFFIPGGVGATEGGNVLIFAAYGLPGTTALSFSILRRFREVFFIAIGLSLFSRYEFKALWQRPAEAESSKLRPE